MRNRRVYLAMSGVVAVALVLAFLGPSSTNPDRKLPEYSKTAETWRTISAKGMVESGEEVVLSSQVQGVVAEVFVSAGDTVDKGQLLLQFDTTRIDAKLLQARAAVAVAEASLADTSAGFRAEDLAMAENRRQRLETAASAARDEYQRLSRLLAKDAVTLVEVIRAKDQMDITESQSQEAANELKKYRAGARRDEIRQAEASRQQALAGLHYIESLARDYRIYAPISGIVAEKLRARGESAEIMTPLFRLINPAQTRIHAELEETDLGKVSEGQKAEVTADAYPDRVFRGSVSRVFPVVQRKTQKSFDPMASFDINTQEIHVHLEDSSALKNGMTVTVRFK